MAIEPSCFERLLRLATVGFLVGMVMMVVKRGRKPNRA
jgi:hypothetical protein